MAKRHVKMVANGELFVPEEVPEDALAGVEEINALMKRAATGDPATCQVILFILEIGKRAGEVELAQALGKGLPEKG